LLFNPFVLKGLPGSSGVAMRVPSKLPLEQLRQQVKQSPLPPADFRIMTALEIADEKRAQFEKNNPEIALWMKIKGVLSGDSGEQYFDSQMKDAEVPTTEGSAG
jgi:hypothetical protein